MSWSHFNKKIPDMQRITRTSWVTEMLAMWIVSQRDNEYNPCHQLHKVLIIFRNVSQNTRIPCSRKEHNDVDGDIIFVNSVSTDEEFCRPQLSVKPQVGDF